MMRHEKKRSSLAAPLARGVAIAVLAWLCAVVPAGAAAGVQARLELDRHLMAAETAGTALVKITLEAPPPSDRAKRPPVNLSLVLDRSGSMSGSKLENAKAAAVEALRRLGGQDFFSVVVYDHQVSTIVPSQAAGRTEWIESQIRQIRSGGNTALFGGVSQGAAEVRKHLGKGYVHRIVLLSDGIANVGPSAPDDLGRLGRALGKEGLSVTTVGVGTDYNEDLMVQLSHQSDGNTYFVESSRDLPRIFTAELGDVLSVVARNVEIVIDCPEGVRPMRIIGRDGRIRGQQVAFSLNQLYGSQEKYALVEVAVPAGKDGHEMEVARAQVRYEDPFTRQSESVSARVAVRFSRDSKRVTRSVNPSVAREAQLNYKALAQEKAIDLADEGKPAAAADALEETAAEMEQFGRQYRDTGVLEEAARIREQAEEVRQKGMSPRSRKVLRTESYQTKHQQMQK